MVRRLKSAGRQKSSPAYPKSGGKAQRQPSRRGIFTDNLEVPPDALIGEDGKGFRYILDGMNAERILVAQECIGEGRWLLKKGIDPLR